MHWEQGKAGQFPPGDSHSLSSFWPVSSPGICPDHAVWPDHASQELCEVQQAAPGTDAAGLASASKGEPKLWFYATLTLHSRVPLGTSDTLNISLLQPKLPVL